MKKIKEILQKAVDWLKERTAAQLFSFAVAMTITGMIAILPLEACRWWAWIWTSLVVVGYQVAYDLNHTISKERASRYLYTVSGAFTMQLIVIFIHLIK